MELHGWKISWKRTPFRRISSYVGGQAVEDWDGLSGEFVCNGTVFRPRLTPCMTPRLTWRQAAPPPGGDGGAGLRRLWPGRLAAGAYLAASVRPSAVSIAEAMENQHPKEGPARTTVDAIQQSR